MNTTKEKIFAKFKGNSEELIPVLQKIQEAEGYLSEESMVDIAKFLRIPQSKVHGVATFYAQFKFEPVGKHIIKICHGTACHVQNAMAITESIENELSIKDGETTKDKMFTFESVACIGCCSLAPVMTIDENTHGKLSKKDIPKIINEYN